MSKLERFLDSIHPSRTMERAQADADRALNSYRTRSSHLDDWDEFQEEMARFHCHAVNVMLKVRNPMQPDMEINWGHCHHHLTNIYGGNAAMIAFQITRTGVEGGFYGVLRAVAQNMAASYAHNEIHSRVNDFLNGLSNNEKLEAAREYLARYGHLLPSEVTEAGGVRVLAYFREFLLEHPRLMQQVGGSFRR